MKFSQSTPMQRKEDSDEDELLHFKEMHSTLQGCLVRKEKTYLNNSNDEMTAQRIANVYNSYLDEVTDPIRSELDRLRKSAATELGTNTKIIFKR